MSHPAPPPYAKCMECGDDIDVDVELPPRLVEDCHAGRLVLFVGSGASTESHNVMPSTFYDVVANQVPDSSGLSFPGVSHFPGGAGWIRAV